MRVLVVEDDPTIAGAVTEALRLAGHEVDHTERGGPVVRSVEKDHYDVAVLDLGLPDMDGLVVLRELRAMKLPIPVLVITARDAIEDRVRGLEEGADDYMIKPFALPELLARVNALHRRWLSTRGDRLVNGSLILELASRRATLSGENLELPTREWQVLECLIRRVEKVVSKEEINTALSQDGEALSDNAVEVYVSRLRAKLEHSGIEIRTVRGFGYMLEAAD
jgi:DNA-binding response OmpR family regulator